MKAQKVYEYSFERDGDVKGQLTLGLNERLLKVVTGILNYSFEDINWDYEALSSEEKKLMTPEDMELLKKYFRY